MSERIQALQSMLANAPENTFVRYALAMEHLNGGDAETAVKEFRAVLDVDPNYSAAYFHGGQALERLGRIEDARALYEKGIEATERSGDLKMRGEIQGALDMLPV